MPWVCTICGTNNPDNEDICFVCDSERSREREEKSSSAQPIASTSRNKKAQNTTPVKKTSSSTKKKSSAKKTSSTKRTTGSSKKKSATRRTTEESSSTTETTRKKGAGTRSRTRESSISRGSAASAASREERLHEEERALKLQESLINARSAITFAVVFASVICGLTKQLKNWAVFEWIVGIGCGAILLFWAICICANSIGYFKIKPKEWLCLPLLGVGLALNITLYLAVGSTFLVPYLWWAVYAVAGGVLSIRHLKGKGKITFGISIAETALAVLLIALPWIV